MYVNFLYAASLTSCQVYYVFWLSKKNVVPSYELWETAATFDLDDVEKYCRESSLKQVRKVMEEGDRLRYFLRKGIRADLLTIMIRELYCRGSRDRPLRAEDAVLAQMAAAQM